MLFYEIHHVYIQEPVANFRKKGKLILVDKSLSLWD